MLVKIPFSQELLIIVNIFMAIIHQPNDIAWKHLN